MPYGVGDKEYDAYNWKGGMKEGIESPEDLGFMGVGAECP